MRDNRGDTAVHHYMDWTRHGRRSVLLHLALVVLGYLALTVGPLSLYPFLKGHQGEVGAQELLKVYAFLPAFLVLPLLLKLLLRRPGYSIGLPRWPPRWRDYLLGWIGGWVALAVTVLVTAPWREVNYVGWGGAGEHGALLIAALLVGFVFQTATEELYFRGVVTQAAYRVLRWMPLALIVQGLFFAQLHIGNIEAWGTGWDAGVPYFIGATMYGLAAWKSGSLLLAAGLHFANNTFIVLFVGVEGDVISGPSPWVLTDPTLNQATVAITIQAALSLAFVWWVTRGRPRPGRSPERADAATG